MFSLTINLPEVAPSLYQADARYPSGLQVTLHSTEGPPTRSDLGLHAPTPNNESHAFEEATQCGASRPCLARAQNASANTCSSDTGTLRSTAQGSTLPGNSIRISTDNSTGAITFDSHLTFSPPSRPQGARISYGKPLSGSPYRKVGSHGLRIQPVDDSHTFEPAAPQEAQSSLSGDFLDQRGPAGPQDSASTMPIRSARGSSNKAAPDASPEIRVDRRREHAIRGRKEKVIWHASRGDAELLAPPMPPAAANLADVYVHVVEGRSSPQVWLRMEPLAWVEAGGGHAHPTLDGYVLHLLLSGEPRWVQRKYYQRYRSFLRKRGKLLPEVRVSGST